MRAFRLDRICFNLDYTLASGQVFRWRKTGDYWTGIVGKSAIKVKQLGGFLEVESKPEDVCARLIHEYFRLGDDLHGILSEINKDPTIRQAIFSLEGLRLISQEPWECLASYICATYTNIPRVRRMVEALSQRFGEPIPGSGGCYSFPSAERLSKCSVDELALCGLGYRSKYILSAAKEVNKGGVDLEALKRSPYSEAVAVLKSLPGVGSKVAECVALFALDKLEAFPVDVWISRIVAEHYGGAKACSPPQRLRQEINDFGRRYFGRYAGYAQQYLFAYYSPVLRRFSLLLETNQG